MGSIPITRSKVPPVTAAIHRDPPTLSLLEPGMQRLYLARDRIEAQFLRDFLERHRIESVVLGDYLSGAAGELPATLFPTVWVLDDDDLERAQELLPRFIAEGQGQPGGARWTCAACGESVEGDFALCWNCGHPRPDPAEG